MFCKRFIYAIIIFAGFIACQVDYEMPESFIDEPDYIVVNSLLTPSKPVKIDFYQTMKTDIGYSFSPLVDVHVLLKENDIVLYDAVCKDSVLEIPYYPKTKHNYYLEASVNGKTIKASTSIPVPATCKTINYFYYSYFHILPEDDAMLISSFKIDTDAQASLWITAYDIFETGDKGQCDEIYTSHPLIDKFNRENSQRLFNPQVGSYFHKAFMRVKNTNLPHLDSLFFLPIRTNLVDIGELNYNKAKSVKCQIKLIMASKEYDQYCKSLFEQKSMIIYDYDILPVFYQPKQVFSNISGGLGIFAGMSETDYFIDIRYGEDF